jgi:hypothetical protein
MCTSLFLGKKISKKLQNLHSTRFNLQCPFSKILRNGYLCTITNFVPINMMVQLICKHLVTMQKVIFHKISGGIFQIKLGAEHIPQLYWDFFLKQKYSHWHFSTYLHNIFLQNHYRYKFLSIILWICKTKWMNLPKIKFLIFESEVWCG